jgi:hypothetical protein
LAESRGAGVGPVERLQVLKRLAQFAGREQIRVQAIVGGRPLREVNHGGNLDGVTVYFAENAQDATDQIAKLYRGGAVVVTSDAQIEERIAGLGGQTIKISTLRKAIEGDGGGGQEIRGDRSQRRRGDRPPRRDRGERGDRGDRDQRPRPDREPQGQDSEPQEQRPERSEPRGDSSVNNLIDLVE